MFKINDRKFFIVDHAWLKLFCDHTCDLFAVAKLLVGTRYSLTYTHVLDLERQNRQLRADTNSPSISPVSPRNSSHHCCYICQSTFHECVSLLLGVYTVRSSDRLVGPTQATSDWSVRPVGQTSRTAHICQSNQCGLLAD